MALTDAFGANVPNKGWRSELPDVYQSQQSVLIVRQIDPLAINSDIRCPMSGISGQRLHGGGRGGVDDGQPASAQRGVEDVVLYGNMLHQAVQRPSALSPRGCWGPTRQTPQYPPPARQRDSPLQRRRRLPTRPCWRDSPRERCWRKTPVLLQPGQHRRAGCMRRRSRPRKNTVQVRCGARRS